MNIFDVGPMEMLVIVAVALIIFGPHRLPEVLGQLGRTVRQIRRMAEDATREFSRELNLEGPEPPKYQYTPPLPPPPVYVPPIGPPETTSNAEPDAVADESAPTYDPVPGGYSLLKDEKSGESNSIGGSFNSAAESALVVDDNRGIHSDFTVPEETEDTPVEFRPSYEVVPYLGPAPDEILSGQNGHSMNGEDAPKPARRRRPRKKPVEVEEVESV